MAGERWDRNRFLYERDERARMRPRDHSDDRFDRPRFHDDLMGDEPRSRRDYRPTLERERERDPSPRLRPSQLRRQSSLDTFDRRPGRRFLDADEYPPPARREDIYREDLYRDDVYRDDVYRDDVYRDDYRAPAYTPIPLPKSRALPPPRRHYDEPDRYPDEDFMRPPYRERELVRERARTHRSSSRSSSQSSRSSGSGGGTTVRSEYPKRGKTRIPARLVSKRALHELGYRFIQENNTVIVQQALGQDNIDELLRLSELYSKADREAAATRSSAATVMEERREEIAYPPPPATRLLLRWRRLAPPTRDRLPSPPPPPPSGLPVEVVDKTRTVVRDVSPARTTTTSTSGSWDSPHHHHHHRHRHHHDDMVVGPVIHRSRSRSRSRHEIRAEIRALERELAHRPKGAELGERDIVRTERLPDGELIVYQERVERQVAGPKPPRIEKDKKGPPPLLLKAMLGTLT
ncbi:carboxypeptidase Y [Ophiocordyceps camponoti-floridani]|uniref:Carboxypeptidase Y n=1 Tax=Ophiocordyceps camponoti-floridani TaxID=2030778 RepID=A0A8H4VH38_9HYPO|nr:carboxypeptidase Y [Ophiocordyceps camponoti-floridani]